VDPILGIVMLVAVAGVALVALVQVTTGRAVKLRELEVRELEAKAKLLDAEARAALPEYVDTSDPASVDAYRKARQELAGRVKERRLE
jgi:hypothetical protein